MENHSPKRLVLRLSSLGDVILSSASLETESSRRGVDWVVASEYADVLRGHPSIQKLWLFDRRRQQTAQGAVSDSNYSSSWLTLSRMLWCEQYEEVIDLHGSIRTKLLRSLFWMWALLEKKQGPKWTVASKQRFRSWGFILFKKWWPERWLSRLQVEVFSKAAGGTGGERPNLTHLLIENESRAPHAFREFQKTIDEFEYICVMPGSNWPGKTWAARKYFQALQDLRTVPVILGQPSDPECVQLVKLLEMAGRPYVSGIGKWDLPTAAKVLASARGFVGSDTGMALLAEAVGTEIVVIYGPTAPGLGFEPWRAGSETVGLDLWCRPCGKIGNRCYRISRKYRCLADLGYAPVARILQRRFGLG